LAALMLYTIEGFALLGFGVGALGYAIVDRVIKWAKNRKHELPPGSR
jgi:hypothetical protein